jgi:hyaluronoglucosaminidase
MRRTPGLVVVVVLSILLAGCGSNGASPTVAPRATCAMVPYSAPAWRSGDTAGGTTQSICMSAATAALLAPIGDEARTLGFAVLDDDACDLRISVAIGAQPSGAAGMPDWSAHRDGYAWTTRVDGASREVTLFANDARGAHFAAHALLTASRAAGGTIPSAAADWPAFATRGVIEGFYNRYFSREERATTLRLMHTLRENTYLYAPKDDPYAGYQWRDPYPADAGADVAAAAALAAQLHVDFLFGISPTLSTNGKDPAASITFSSSADFAALLAKLATLKALGVQRFALFYDDASNALSHPEDRAAYPTLAAAHADLANRLAAALDAPLLIVGDYYSSQFAGWQAYNQELGQKLSPAVSVMWTGPEVFSTTLAPSDLTAVNQLLGRKVVIWDNWPTSAVPVTGRDPHLSDATDAILTNATLVGDFGHPVADFWRVLPPLADYAWSPTTYSAADSFASAQSLEPGMVTCAQ